MSNVVFQRVPHLNWRALKTLVWLEQRGWKMRVTAPKYQPIAVDPMTNVGCDLGAAIAIELTRLRRCQRILEAVIANDGTVEESAVA